MTTTLKTENEVYGFTGTIDVEALVNELWVQASVAIAEATGGTPEQVRNFLDGRYGRHFADLVNENLDGGCGSKPDVAIAQAVVAMNNMRISRSTAREFSVALGTGFLAAAVLAS